MLVELAAGHAPLHGKADVVGIYGRAPRLTDRKRPLGDLARDRIGEIQGLVDAAIEAALHADLAIGQHFGEKVSMQFDRFTVLRPTKTSFDLRIGSAVCADTIDVERFGTRANCLAAFLRQRWTRHAVLL